MPPQFIPAKVQTRELPPSRQRGKFSAQDREHYAVAELISEAWR